jgi:hypothetical protein
MIAEREVDGHTALVLRSEGPDGIEACFVPATGMVGCSLLHRGEELLGQRGGLAKYVAERSTMGVHLLDYLHLRELAGACDEAGRWEFLFVAAPLRIPGGTGSPLNPIAIF